VGKAKKLALTACMRKLLTILNAMVKSGTSWRAIASQPACFSRQLLTPSKSVDRYVHPVVLWHSQQ